MMRWGIAALAVYCVLLYALALGLVYVYPQFSTQMVHRRAHFLRQTRFLFGRAKPHYYYFPALQLTRSLLVALLPVVWTHPWNQIFAYGVVCLVYFSAQLAWAPWRSWATNYGDAAISIVLLFVAQVGALRLDPDESEYVNAAVAQDLLVTNGLLLAVPALVLLVALAYFLWLKAYRHERNVEYRAVLVHDEAYMGATARWLQAQFRIAGEKVLVDADTPRLGRDHLLEVVRYHTRAVLVLVSP